MCTGSVLVRPVDPADAAALRRFYAGLSAQSRRCRFMTPVPGIAARRADAYCRADHLHAEGFVAVLEAAEDSDHRIVGHLCLEPAGRDAVEVAVAVADDMQRLGIGRRLFAQALAWAERRGMRQIVATALADNVAVLGLLSMAPGARAWPAEDGMIDVEIPIGVAAGGPARSSP